MPKKRSTGKTRSRKPKPRQKQKQKQKQIQKVSVSVSGGGSGSGGFIPIPQAPAFDYSLLANLIRPAATVDMPIVVQAARPVANLPVASGIEARSASGSIRPSFSSSSAKAASAPMRIPKQPAESRKVGGGNSSKVQFASSESESERDLRMPDKSSIPIFADPYKNMSSSRDAQYYRSSPSAFIPEGGIGKGKKTKYETDIFGRDMAMTSSISASPSFEMTGGGSSSRKSNIVSYLDLPSGGESEAFGRRAYDKMKSSSRFS